MGKIGNNCTIRPWEWEDDQVIAACLDYRTKSELKERNESAYICISYRNLWGKITWLRDRHSERRGKFTDDEIIEKSRAYAGDGRGAFQKAEPCLYAAAYRRGLLDSMPWLDDPQGRTTAQILESSRAYSSVEEFRERDLSGYSVLRKRGALDAITWFSTDESVPAEERERRERYLQAVREGRADEFLAEEEGKKAEAEAPAEPAAEPEAPAEPAAE